MKTNVLRPRLLAAVSIFIVSLPFVCVADLIGSGTLYFSDGGILAGDGWANSGTTFSYHVSQAVPGGPILYSYTFTGINKDLSHLDIGVSTAYDDLPAFSSSNPMDYFGGPAGLNVLTGNDATYDPYVDDDVTYPVNLERYLRFELPKDAGGVWPTWVQTDGDTWTMSFYSYRLPIETDFYAKDGYDQGTEQWAFAFNSGLILDDGAKILGPDTAYVPVPGAILLGFLGLGYAGMKLRKVV